MCHICNDGVIDSHDPKHTLMFCETCNQYVSSDQHRHYNTSSDAKCKNNEDIYCVSCKKCSPAENKKSKMPNKCKYCSNAATGVICGNGDIYAPTYVCGERDGFAYYKS